MAALSILAIAVAFGGDIRAEAAPPIVYQEYQEYGHISRTSRRHHKGDENHGYRHSDKEYGRAVERENKRHEENVSKIQRKYRNHAQQEAMNREMRREQERHIRALRDAEKNYR